MKKIACYLFAIVLLGCGSSSKSVAKKNPDKLLGIYSVSTELISRNEHCATINAKVFLTSDGQSQLVTSSNVQIGNCAKYRLTNKENTRCKERVYKRDYFYSTKETYNYCIVDLFKNDEVLYTVYVAEKLKTLEIDNK